MPPKFNRGLDEQVLEGGAGGMGGAGGRYTSSGKKAFDPDKDAMNTLKTGLGIPFLTVGAGAGIKKINDQQNAYDEVRKKDAEKEAEAKTSKKDKDVEGKKKGGSVKGWGIARGARKAKMY